MVASDRLPFLVDRDVAARVERLELGFNPYGIDPYGVSRTAVARAMTMLRWAYRSYFRVEVKGIEHVPEHGGAMIVGNHSGGVAVDAALLIGTCFYELEPPRLAQGMAEKFINRMPFGSLWSSRTGQFTGLPEQAVRLLRDGRLLMVFPEGARGTAKLYWDRRSLVRFGTGFVRVAMQAGAPIVPVAILGGGEAIPTIFNAEWLGRLIGAPYLPVTPYLLPIPLPVKFRFLFGEPMRFDGDGTEDDEVIAEHVEVVRARIAQMIEEAA